MLCEIVFDSRSSHCSHARRTFRKALFGRIHRSRSHRMRKQIPELRCRGKTFEIREFPPLAASEWYTVWHSTLSSALLLSNAEHESFDGAKFPSASEYSRRRVKPEPEPVAASHCFSPATYSKQSARTHSSFCRKCELLCCRHSEYDFP